jgi:NAD(P)-dependent dehydrogenase (short-subunit alcohol dehydrogenase family)
VASRPVNNAGGAHGIDRIGDIQDKDIDTMFATNVLGLIALTQLLVKGLSVCLSVSPDPIPHPLAPSSPLATP